MFGALDTNYPWANEGVNGLAAHRYLTVTWAPGRSRTAIGLSLLGSPAL